MQRTICAFFLFASMSLSVPGLSVAAYFEGMEAYRQNDFKTAMREFKASDNDVKSYYMLGILLEKGEGVKSDFSEAAEWYRKAADKGDAAAQYRLGRLYERGQGVEESREEAIKLYRKSARQGYANAKQALKRLEGK